MSEYEIRLRNDRYYVCWYDPIVKRTRRASLRTRSLVVAESKARAVYEFVSTNSSIPAAGDVRLDWMQWARRMCKRARENAKAKGRVYNLTPEYVAILIEVQERKCAITGYPFDASATYRNPFAPSLDQIYPGAGYTETNVRVVLTLVNTAMNMWGPVPFLKLVKYMWSISNLRSNGV